MNIVENIRSLCKSNGTSIPKLEKELSFGNGAIYNWDKNSPSIDKIQKVADHFKVPVDIVLYGFELTKFEEYFRIIMSRRTCEQFSEDTGIDLGIVEDYAYGISTERPSLELVKKLADENPYKFIVDDESLFESAGYQFEGEESKDLITDIPLELLRHYQEQGMSESEMAVAYAKYRDAEFRDAIQDGYEPETIAAHHDGEDWTEEELKDIEEFKELLRLKRQLKKNRE